MVSLSENGWPSLRNKKEVLTKFCAVIETVILTNAADRMNLNMGVYFERKIRNLEMKSLIGKSTPNRRIPIIHGHQRNDPYFWMNQRDSQPVLDYIQAENAYSASYFGEMNPLVESLMTEFDNRIDPHEKSAPFEMNGVLYQWQSLEEKDYRQLTTPKTAAPILFFDKNERAKEENRGSCFRDD